MKNLQILFCLACMVFVINTIHAQVESKNHSIGIQLNPYLDSHFWQRTFIKPVFAGRFAFNLNKHISVGPEISGFFVKWNPTQYDLKTSNINLGGFFRYSIMPTSRIEPFLEVSPYYTFYHFLSNTMITPEGVGKEINKQFLTGYLSPGFTLYSKNRKFSLDLMYKFSNKEFVNYHKSAFSYRLNFNF